MSITVTQRYATSPAQLIGMDTEETRKRYLVDNLFSPDEVTAVYTHHDRIVIAGILPVKETVSLPGFPEIRSDHFFDHREAGIVNVGGTGTIIVDGENYRLVKGACLYVGRGKTAVEFASDDSADPARFYLFSAPAHTEYPTALVEPGQGTIRELGDQKTSNRRTLNQYIHEDGIKSCQVVMGVTQLHEGSMWNTMPSHTHDRRTECYLYFDVPEDQRVIHLMGKPQETRHMLVANNQAIISPSWSIHSGVGTEAYSFVWSMAGENQSFDDMDTFPVTEML